MTAQLAPRGFEGRRSLIAFGLAALLPIALLSVVLVRMSSEAIRTKAENQVETSARASAKAIEQELRKLSEIVEIYSHQPATEVAVSTADDAARGEVVRSMFENDPDVSLAFVVDEGGVLLNVLPDTPDAIGVDFSFRDWFQGVSTTQQVYVSEAFQPQTELPLTVTVAAPVFRTDAPQVVAGYIGVGLTLVDLQAYVDDFAATQDVLLTVTDQSGVVVASPGSAPVVIESLRGEPAIDAALRGLDTQRERERDGESYLSATASVDDFGWTVTADVRTSEALAARRSIITVAGSLVLILALFVFAAMARLNRSWQRQNDFAERRRESEAFLESIIENVPSAVTVKNASDLTFVRANRAALEVLRTDRDSVIGGTIADFTSAELAARLKADDRAVIAGRVPTVKESVRLHEQFGDRLLNVRQIPMVGPEGEVDYLLEIADDVTEVLESIQSLEEAWAEAQHANEAKSEFLSRMSHELRTPLNAVLGFGQLLEFEELNGQQAESVQQILRGGRHLLGLINEVLDISRIESGNLSLSLEPVSLQGLISETVELIRPLANTAEVSIPEGNMPDWELWARADQQRLRQVMLNLLSNAVKYNDRGGSISIRCREVDESRLRISVADTGRGVSDDQIQRLFSPFERLGAEGSPVEGTGLGLALTKRLVEAMNGSIGVESALGIGTTFWIELVVSHESDLVIGAPTTGLDHERADDVARLLHVEDSLEQLRWVEELVSAHPDIELISVADAETAMDMAVRFQPDALLLDLDVRGVDAHQLLRRLAADAATSSIVVVTIGDEPSSAAEAHRHLQRPISDADLLAAATDALAVARAMSH